MFEDSLIESGNKLKTKRGGTTTISFLFQVVIDLRPGADSAAIHGSSAESIVDDLAGGATATAATTATASSGSGERREGGADRYHQRSVAHPHQDSRQSPDD